MFGVLSVFAFVIAFVLYAVGGGKAPFDPEGVMLIGLALLAAHTVWELYPWRRR